MAAKKILIIGGGPGGYPAALHARELGAEVALAEKSLIGGVCLNWGCIPSKSFLDAAHRFHTVSTLGALLDDSAKDALSGVLAGISWEKIQSRRKGLLDKLRSGLRRTIESKGIRIVEGTASFISDNEAEIKTAAGAVRETFDAAIIAAGTAAFYPPPFDAHKDKLLDNVSVFSLERKPKSVVIIGGGVIGLEFGCFFNALGCEVSIVEMQPALLPGEDEAVSRALAQSFEKRGVKLHLGKTAKSVSFDGGMKTVALSDGTALTAEEVLVAVGRVAELSALNLDKIGVSWDRKGIKVDDRLRVSGKSNIYAVGDVNGLMQLAHAATAQGETAAANIMGADEAYDNSAIPRCVYAWPEAASIGLNKAQAEKAGLTPKTHRAFFLGSGRALTQNETEGFVQAVSDADTGRLLGAQIVGAGASELIHIFAVALSAKMTAAQLRRVIFGHPTMSETIHDALAR
ncbi:MAG: dihydrolipoyl dehydrogenase [Elusimicrobiales bacterium]|nr:dihydrolipoyl dehydrogenase [Elusimicrobiales bacterium]